MPGSDIIWLCNRFYASNRPHLCFSLLSYKMRTLSYISGSQLSCEEGASLKWLLECRYKFQYINLDLQEIYLFFPSK